MADQPSSEPVQPGIVIIHLIFNSFKIIHSETSHRIRRTTRRNNALVPPAATSSDIPVPAPLPTQHTAPAATSSDVPLPAPHPTRHTAPAITSSDIPAATIPAPHPAQRTTPPIVTSSDIPAPAISIPPPHHTQHMGTSSSQPPPIILNDPPRFVIYLLFAMFSHSLHILDPIFQVDLSSYLIRKRVFFFGDVAKLTNRVSTIQMPIAGPSGLPPNTTIPDPLPFTPPRQYQFVMQNPGDQGTLRNRRGPPPEVIEPSRNVYENRQRANAILYTPRSRRRRVDTQNRSAFDSPTPATSARQPEPLASDSGSDEPEELIQRLNLGQPSTAAPTQARRFMPAAVGPLHGRPGRKPPGEKSGNRLRKDIWQWTKEEDGRNVCLFCKYVKN